MDNYAVRQQAEQACHTCDTCNDCFIAKVIQSLWALYMLIILSNCIQTTIFQQKKGIQNFEAQIQSMKIFHTMKLSTLLAKFKPSAVKHQLDAERVNLKQAEIEQRISKISTDWEAEKLALENRKANVVKKSGNDLINIESMDESPEFKQWKRPLNEFAAMNRGTAYDGEPHIFRVPTLTTAVSVCNVKKF